MSNEKAITVTAIVGPGFFNNSIFDLTFDGWKGEGQGGSLLKFFQPFPKGSTEEELVESIENLQRILLSLYLYDYVSRIIFFFEFSSTLTLPEDIVFINAFGFPPRPLEREEHKLMPDHLIGKAFDRFPLLSMHKRANEIELDLNFIRRWYKFFSDNNNISESIMLIQEGFGIIAETSKHHRFTSLTSIDAAIILITSGLEGIFTKGEGTSDIVFKFQIVGATFYEYFADISVLEVLLPRSEKFAFSEFKSILGLLYDFRSKIAHGGGLSVFDMKKKRADGKKDTDNLAKFLKILHVHEPPKEMKHSRISHFLHAMEILEIHILAMIIGANENLAKGVKILDEFLPKQNPLDFRPQS